MRNGEFEIFRNELLDVWAADGVEVGDFDDLENLFGTLACPVTFLPIELNVHE